MNLPFALTSYGLPHVLGTLKTRSGEAHPSPLTPLGFLDYAAAQGLAGVDMPIPDDVPVAVFADALTERRLRLVAECMGLLEYDLPTAVAALTRARDAGATVVRFVLSRLLCGDRRGLPGGWSAHRDALGARLREVLPIAEDIGVSLALENHQDATTDDLLWLYEQSGESQAYGVCLDCGNPLAVGEEPIDAARRLAPLLRHLHLKDYTIHAAPNGYRLVRCAAGTGVVDFPAILAIARANGFDALLPGIEIAAQQTRTIPILEDGWWAEHTPRDARTLLGALRLLWEKGQPQDAPYASAWERGDDSAAVSAEEWRVVEDSIAYFRGLT
jgi:sugar phosphate isomerase/epimerase